MKHPVKSAAIIVAAFVTIFAQPAHAAGTKATHEPVASHAAAGNSFSIELNQQSNNEIIFLTIKNPGKKKLSVTLKAPDGYTIDNFYTGKKDIQLDKKYNFSEADAGVYTIVVTDGVEKIKKQIKLERIPVHQVNRLEIQ